MPFEKGNTLGRGKGRPKGSPNRSTQEARELLESNRNALIQRALDLALVKTLDKTNVTILNKLLDKLIPTLQATDHSGYIADRKPDWSKFTTEELRKAVGELSN